MGRGSRSDADGVRGDEALIVSDFDGACHLLESLRRDAEVGGEDGSGMRREVERGVRLGRWAAGRKVSPVRLPAIPKPTFINSININWSGQWQ